MEEKIEELKREAAEAVKKAAKNLNDLNEIRVKYLGKKGEITGLLRGLGQLSKEDRPRIGQIVNEARQQLEALIADKNEELKTKELESRLASEKIDVTLPGRQAPLGHLHPLTLTLNRIKDIFMTMGFSVEEGPEIERDYFNFEALNLPKDHPARDMQDTFFIQRNPDILLRTHTSSVQVHDMETMQPPIRTITPGRVFRNEAISYRAHCMFHQIEGLYIDENVSFADLKQTLLYFAKELFGENSEIRMRPSYFPFTEPSAEVDVSCSICGGKGCNVCKYTGWLEILGCGMVDPNVLEASGIDSQKYTGFAFGMGIERIAMLKFGINDLRLYFENDVRFLQQFQSAH